MLKVYKGIKLFDVYINFTQLLILIIIAICLLLQVLSKTMINLKMTYLLKTNTIMVMNYDKN